MRLLKEWAPLIGLAGAMLGAMAWFDGRQAARMDAIEGRLTDRMERIEGRLVARMDSIEAKVDSQGERIARVEGLLKGRSAGSGD